MTFSPGNPPAVLPAIVHTHLHKITPQSNQNGYWSKPGPFFMAPLPLQLCTSLYQWNSTNITENRNIFDPSLRTTNSADAPVPRWPPYRSVRVFPIVRPHSSAKITRLWTNTNSLHPGNGAAAPISFHQEITTLVRTGASFRAGRQFFQRAFLPFSL